VLSPDGDEIERVPALPPEALAARLRKLYEAAAHDRLRHEDVAGIGDALTLLVQGRLAERRTPPDFALALEAYRAAERLDPHDAGGVGAEAAFAALRLSTRESDVASHRKALAVLTKRFPEADVTRRFGAWANGVAQSPDVSGVTDPLAPQSVAPPPLPKEIAEMFARERQMSRRVVAACAGEPRPENELVVRLTIRDSRVQHASLLEPDAQQPLRRCIESTLAEEGELPKLFGEKRVIHILFGGR
jgi:hypothetical protein